MAREINLPNPRDFADLAITSLEDEPDLWTPFQRGKGLEGDSVESPIFVITHRLDPEKHNGLVRKIRLQTSLTMRPCEWPYVNPVDGWRLEAAVIRWWREYANRRWGPIA